ncbi:MAG: CAP domain-containing protein [Mucilaginibacter polytrichastri]|nr:CAP domain-containing protein [Mucilaginibacter polytrichastri]
MKTLCAALLIISVSFPAMPPAGKSPVKTASFRNQILNEVNRLRARGCRCGTIDYPPAPPLRWNTLLEQSARVHARDMRRRRFFSHTGSDGSNATQRIKRQGYLSAQYGTWLTAENIAFGYPSIKRVIYEWQISPGHCRNMMNPAMQEMGAAEIDRYWVQDLGMRR